MGFVIVSSGWGHSGGSTAENFGGPMVSEPPSFGHATRAFEARAPDMSVGCQKLISKRFRASPAP